MYLYNVGERSVALDMQQLQRFIYSVLGWVDSLHPSIHHDIHIGALNSPLRCGNNTNAARVQLSTISRCTVCLPAAAAVVKLNQSDILQLIYRDFSIFLSNNKQYRGSPIHHRESARLVKRAKCLVASFMANSETPNRMNIAG